MNEQTSERWKVATVVGTFIAPGEAAAGWLKRRLDHCLRLEAEKLPSIDLIARLAPEKGVYDGETGDCLLCNGDWVREEHTPDCPWVEARKLLAQRRNGPVGPLRTLRERS